MGSGPLIMAHRGLARHAPENTLAAYAAALELGFGLEVDLGMTTDQQVVMIHDHTLERTTNGQGLVSQHSLAEIRALDAGSWFDASFSGQRVPTLEETLAMIRERWRSPTLVALDLKPGGEPFIGRICRDVARHGLVQEAVVFGLPIRSREARQRFKEVDAAFPTATLVDSPDELGQAMADNSADWLYIRFIPTSQQVLDAHAAGKRVLKGGPLPDDDEADNWRRLRDVGVDVILSDFPLECRKALR